MSHATLDWEQDWIFRRLAEVLWSEDYRRATHRGKGMRAASRAMQQRYEGFMGHRRLAEVRDRIAKLADDVKLVLR